MKITLITACYNSIATIRDALESVRRQVLLAGIELEHLVIDGGSTDGTEAFATISERDKGLYDALNKGIRMATGDVIGILNADDVLAGDDVVARVAQAFMAGGGACGHVSDGACGHAGCVTLPADGSDRLDAVYGRVRFVNELGGRTVRRCFARLWQPWMLQWGYMPPHPGLFIRRECFVKWGGYVGDRDEYKIAADCELIIRYFRVHKMRAKYLGICTTVMRTGGVSTKDVNARIVLNKEVIKANRRNGYFCCWPMLLPKYVVKIWEVILPRIGFTGA